MHQKRSDYSKGEQLRRDSFENFATRLVRQKAHPRDSYPKQENGDGRVEKYRDDMRNKQLFSNRNENHPTTSYWRKLSSANNASDSRGNSPNERTLKSGHHSIIREDAQNRSRTYLLPTPNSYPSHENNLLPSRKNSHDSNLDLPIANINVPDSKDGNEKAKANHHVALNEGSQKKSRPYLLPTPNIKALNSERNNSSKNFVLEGSQIKSKPGLLPTPNISGSYFCEGPQHDTFLSKDNPSHNTEILRNVRGKQRPYLLPTPNTNAPKEDFSYSKTLEMQNPKQFPSNCDDAQTRSRSYLLPTPPPNVTYPNPRRYQSPDRRPFTHSSRKPEASSRLEATTTTYLYDQSSKRQNCTKSSGTHEERSRSHSQNNYSSLSKEGPSCNQSSERGNYNHSSGDHEGRSRPYLLPTPRKLESDYPRHHNANTCYPGRNETEDFQREAKHEYNADNFSNKREDPTQVNWSQVSLKRNISSLEEEIVRADSHYHAQRDEYFHMDGNSEFLRASLDREKHFDIKQRRETFDNSFGGWKKMKVEDNERASKRNWRDYDWPPRENHQSLDSYSKKLIGSEPCMDQSSCYEKSNQVRARHNLQHSIYHVGDQRISTIEGQRQEAENKKNISENTPEDKIDQSELQKEKLENITKWMLDKKKRKMIVNADDINAICPDKQELILQKRSGAILTIADNPYPASGKVRTDHLELFRKSVKIAATLKFFDFASHSINIRWNRGLIEVTSYPSWLAKWLKDNLKNLSDLWPNANLAAVEFLKVTDIVRLPVGLSLPELDKLGLEDEEMRPDIGSQENKKQPKSEAED